MKQRFIKPGFELVFALSIIAIFGLPPLVFAQNTKDVEIKITNGDTIVNGKNIKDLEPSDREQALKDIRNLGNMGEHPLLKTQSFNQHILTRKSGPGDTIHQKVIIQDVDPYASGKIRSFAFKNDSSLHRMRFKFRRPGGKDSAMAFNFRIEPDRNLRLEQRDFNFNDRDMEMPMRGRGFGMMRRNTQNFDYSNTGTDGMTTHVSFRVTDVPPEKAKQVTGFEKAELALTDLNIVPEFTSGKTMLMFNLSAHAIAEVKFMDHDGKVIWSDRVLNGSFSKKFELGLNGMYLLEVKQAGKVALKRVIKEE